MLNILKRTIFLVLLLVCSLAVPAQAQTAAEQEIKQMLEQRDREIKSVLGNKSTVTDAQREQLKALINDDIDFLSMSQAALGTYWNDLSATQRTEFVEVFSDIVRAQSLADLEIYKATIVYDDIIVTGDEAQVLTTTTYKDTPTRVTYAMSRAADGSWNVDDFSIDDVSTVEGYQRSFQTVLRKKGFDALMNSLNKKWEQMQATS